MCRITCKEMLSFNDLVHCSGSFVGHSKPVKIRMKFHETDCRCMCRKIWAFSKQLTLDMCYII